MIEVIVSSVPPDEVTIWAVVGDGVVVREDDEPDVTAELDDDEVALEEVDDVDVAALEVVVVGGLEVGVGVELAEGVAEVGALDNDLARTTTE